jgi:peptidoglycan/LPS O-acetylase OafA/YrhL
MTNSSVGSSGEIGLVPAQLDFRKRLPSLDGVRGIAILSVFMYHYAGGLGRNTGSAALHALGWFTGLGWSGVDLFFVLSGFLITGILVDTQRDPGYYRTFYIRRVLRIFPIYYLFLLICAILAIVFGLHLGLAHLSFLVYLGYPAALIWPAIVQVTPAVAVTHLWSLSVEEQFYMLWPFMIARFKTPERILRGCFVIIILSLGYRALIWIPGGLPDSWAYASLPGRMDSLAFGAVAAVLVRGPLQRRVAQWAPLICAAGIISFIIICGVRRAVTHSDPLVLTLGLTALGLGNSGLVILAASGGRLASMLSLRVLRIFGKYSYGLYLYHFPLSVLLSRQREHFVAATHSMILGSILFVVFAFGTNLAVAAISFRFIESPLLSLKSRFGYKPIEPQQDRVAPPHAAATRA